MPGPPSASTRASPVGAALETIVSSPSSSAAVALSCVSAPVTRTTGFRPEMTAVGAVGAERHAIGPVGALDDHVVDRAVAGAVEPAEVDRDVAHVGAGEVADGHVVGAAQRADRGRLDAVDVQRDVGDVAERRVTRGPLASSVICSPTLEPLKSSVSVPPSPSTTSRAVARIPLQVVVAGAAVDRVGADVAVHEVVADAAEQRVRAVAAAHAVVAVAAVERQRASACRSRSGRRACRCRRRP